MDPSVADVQRRAVDFWEKTAAGVHDGGMRRLLRRSVEHRHQFVGQRLAVVFRVRAGVCWCWHSARLVRPVLPVGDAALAWLHAGMLLRNEVTGYIERQLRKKLLQSTTDVVDPKKRARTRARTGRQARGRGRCSKRASAWAAPLLLSDFASLGKLHRSWLRLLHFSSCL